MRNAVSRTTDIRYTKRIIRRRHSIFRFHI
jgi:hypothetical protein